MDEKYKIAQEGYALMTEELIRGGLSGTECAVTMVALSLRILKTTLSPQEFHEFILEIQAQEQVVTAIGKAVGEVLH